VSDWSQTGRELRGCFVTGTDTGAGKTVLAAALAAGLRSRGVDVAALKPVLTGLEDEGTDPDWPHDHVLLARAAQSSADDVALERFGPPVSPHLAAELADRPISPTRLVQRIHAAARGHEVVVVEGVGGLLVPLTPRYDVRDLARSLGLPLLIAARPGLGTINHTLLTLAAARAAGLQVLAVVLTPWPDRPGEVERSNLASIAALGGVAVGVLPHIERPEFELLAQAAQSLPLERWLAQWLVDDLSGPEWPVAVEAPILVAAASDRRRE
jgi:dethiobiotin synthetase